MPLVRLIRIRPAGYNHLIKELEQKVLQKLNVSHAIALSQARLGIYLAVKALIKTGQKVIMSPYTIYDVVNMVICAGGVPVFADILSETCNIDIREIEKLIDNNTGAVIVTHLHGLDCGIEQVVECCRSKGIPLIEDASQAFGGCVNGRPLGTFGDVGIYSFGRIKHVNAFIGGLAVTDDSEIDKKMQEIVADFPFEGLGRLSKRVAGCLAGNIVISRLVFSLFTFWFFRYGCIKNVKTINKLVSTEDNPVLRQELPESYRTRMTPMQARLVLSQLDRVDQDIQERISNAKTYHNGLSDIPGILLPPMREDGSHIYLAYPVQVKDRWGLVKYLMKNGRDLVIQHIGNTSDLECFKRYFRDCPIARKTANEVVLLPTFPGYKESEIQKNISLIHRYFNREE